MEKTVKILVIAFAVVGLGLLGYYWINQWHNRELALAREQERQIHQQRIAQMEAELQKLIEEVGPHSPALSGDTDMADVFGSQKPMTAIQATDCKKVTSQAVAFFQYLDSKAYLLSPGANARAEVVFEDLFKQLTAHPPTNVGEMDNLYTLIRNVTHFYRVLGKDRIDLVKEILQNESAVVEPAMAVMFTWMTTCNAGDGGPLDSTRLKSMYQYACFFLNTLGGRGYLLRRDSKTRMMINYYSLLLVDMANDAKLNVFGIDVRPHIDYVFYDINNQKGLMYRQRYLTNLAALKNKYQ
ncbi:MAG: hypothetical protein C4519_08990 [Desulfobacteraceae bacterium]|nr:MAG: hypothetical protein C4519_08990 [Desulfobacteraceae bacterium]